MSPQSSGWWQASDGRWYPPQQPAATAVPPTPNDGMTPVPLPSVPNHYGDPAYGNAHRVCVGCGGAVMATASVCPRCGTMFGTPKDKTVAVLLAIFLAPWNWLYTYKRDMAKFWVGLSVMFVGSILAVFLIGLPMLFGVWLWAVIDASTKPDSYYRQFPHG